MKNMNYIVYILIVLSFCEQSFGQCWRVTGENISNGPAAFIDLATDGSSASIMYGDFATGGDLYWYDDISGFTFPNLSNDALRTTPSSLYTDDDRFLIAYEDISDNGVNVLELDFAFGFFNPVGQRDFVRTTGVGSPIVVVEGFPMVMVGSEDNGGLATVYFFDGVDWQLFNDIDGISDGPARELNLAYEDDRLIASFVEDFTDQVKVLEYSPIDGWVLLGDADFSNPVSFDHQLAFKDGYIYVSYVDQANGMKVHEFDSGVWLDVTLDLEFAGPIFEESKYALDIQGGYPIIAYISAADGFIYVTTLSGGTWLDVGDQPSIDRRAGTLDMVASGDNIDVAFTDFDNGDILNSTRYFAQGRPPLDLIASSLELNCEDESVVLTASSSGGDDPIITYEWSTGEAGDSIVVSEPGLYSVTVTNRDFSCPGEASIVISSTVTDVTAIVDLVGGTTIDCRDTEIELDASSSANFFAFARDPSGNDIGSIRRDQDGNWTDNGTLNGFSPEFEQLNEVASSADGSRVVFVTPSDVSIDYYEAIVKQYDGEWNDLGSRVGVYGSDFEDGYKVDMSGDGTHYVVGSPGDDSETGKVEVFQLDNDEWRLDGNVITGASFDDRFGLSVGISASGSFVTVGSPGSESVHTYIQLDSFIWSEVTAPVLAIEDGDETGSQAALSDNMRLAVASPGFDGDRGAVRIFSFTGSSWNQLGPTLTGSMPGMRFGEALSISAQGDHVIVGSPAASIAQVFEWSGSEWTQLGTDFTSVEANDQTGFDVDITADGRRIIIGSPGVNQGIGAIRLFKYQSDQWSQIGQELRSDETQVGKIVDIADVGFNAVRYLWSNGETTPAITVTSPGDYSVIVEDTTSRCTATSLVTTITDIRPTFSPTLMASSGGVISCAQPVVTLEVDEPGDDGSYTYLWSTGESGGSIDVSSQGTYEVIITDPESSCSDTSTIVVSEDLAPPVATIATPDGTMITSSTPMVRLDASTSTGSGSLSYNWSTGETGSIISVGVADTYTVTVTDGSNGCTASAAVDITDMSCRVVISGDTRLDCNTTQITLEAMETSGATDFDLNWSTGATGNTITVSTPGTYEVYLQVNSPSSCRDTASITIVEDVILPLVDIAVSADTILNCRQSEAILTATTSTATTLDYLWSSGESTESIMVDQGGVYSVTVTDTQNGCTSSDALEIVDENLDLEIIGPTSVCEGEVLSLSLNVVDGTVLWMGPDSFTSSVRNPEILNVAGVNAGMYIAEVTLDNGCTYTASLQVDVNALPQVTFSTPSITVCEGEDIVLQIVTGPDEMVTWSGPNGFFSQQATATKLNSTIDDAGIYVATLVSMQGCVNAGEVEVTVAPQPTVIIEQSGNECSGPVELKETGGQAVMWSWMGPGGFSSMDAVVLLEGATLRAGSYNVEVEDANGCTNMSSVQLDLTTGGGTELEKNFLISSNACVGDSIRFIDYSDVDSLDNINFAWSFGDGQTSTDRDPVHTYQASGVYQVGLQAEGGDCPELVISKQIEILDCKRNGIAEVYLTVFPNPSSEQVTVVAELVRPGHAVVTVRDNLGRLLETVEHPETQSLRQEVQFSQTGLYLITVEHEFGRESFPVIIL